MGKPTELLQGTLDLLILKTLALETPHPGTVHFEMEGRAGEPSRWNTLRALRVLRWASAL